MEKHLEVCGIPPFDGPREINDFYYREVNPAQPTRTRVIVTCAVLGAATPP